MSRRIAINGKPSEYEPLLTPGEVAALYRVAPTTVTQWARRGLLPSIRPPGNHRRYRESEIQALINSSRGGDVL